MYMHSVKVWIAWRTQEVFKNVSENNGVTGWRSLRPGVNPDHQQAFSPFKPWSCHALDNLQKAQPRNY